MVNILKQDFDKNMKLYKSIEADLRKEIAVNIPIIHVGSTAIPNMYGKNIIDILIGAKDEIELKKIANILTKKGYVLSTKSITNNYNFFASKKEETGPGDIHIHLAIITSEQYLNFIILKNYLLNNKKEALDYSNFKKQIINNEIVERKNYKEIKSKYVDNLLKRAKEYYNSLKL